MNIDINQGFALHQLARRASCGPILPSIADWVESQFPDVRFQIERGVYANEDSMWLTPVASGQCTEIMRTARMLMGRCGFKSDRIPPEDQDLSVIGTAYGKLRP